jgi:exo-beta-1,3-glucanase (GH17 family)
MVGSETQFRRDISLAQLSSYVTRVRGILDTLQMNDVPIYISEAQPAVQENPAILGIPGVDVNLVNVYPFFQSGGINVASAGDNFMSTMSILTGLNNQQGGKRLGVGETGWPTG